MAFDPLRALVGRVDDAMLERTLGSLIVERALLGVLARRYRPEVAPGFRGTIVLELTHPATGGPNRAFTLDVHGIRAVATPGPPDDGLAAVWLRLSLRDLLSIGLGLIDPAEPLLTGRASLSGDLELGSRLPEMFGAPQPR